MISLQNKQSGSNNPHKDCAPLKSKLIIVVGFACVKENCKGEKMFFQIVRTPR